MENIEQYLSEVDREEFRISHSFSSSANGSSVSSTSSHKEIIVHRVTKSKTNSNLTSSPHQTTLNDNSQTMTASQIDPESTNVEHHQLADSFAAQAKQRLLRTIDNVVERQQLQFADENNENKCPNRVYRRSPIKKHQQFQKACDDPAMKNFKSTVEKFANDIMQKDELIEKLKNENSLLVRQKDHEMDTSLALNIASTEHNYYLFEIDRLKKIINDEVSENEALKKKVEQLKKSLSEMSKEHERFEVEKRTIFGQIEALKIDNKTLSDENYLLKIKCLNMTQQMQILEAQNVEQLLNDNAAFKDENTALMRQIEMLQMEINKGSQEFETKFATLKKCSDEEIAKLKSRMSENETKYSNLIKDYDTCLTQCQSDIERLNKERSSFLKNLTSLQEEREKAREDLKSCRDSYEHRLTELSSELDTYKKSLANMNELSVDQQKRIERWFSDFEEKSAQSEKLLRSKEEEVKRAKQAQQRSEEQIKFNEVKHAKDVDEIKKKAKKDVDEWRFKYEQTASNNAELSRANGEMRRRLQAIEVDIKELAEKNLGIKHSLETAQRQKREMREDMERNVMTMKKEIDTLLQLREESNRKIGSHQAAMNRLQQQLDERQKELVSLSERNRALELKCRVGETYKAKYNDIKTYLRRGLYESSQMSINNNDSGRAQFFNKMIKELRIESNELDPNSS